ncbi:hypothetical protein GIB67_034639 [Kingdonia uniflora]|uniref:Myb/SANT-like DNA-binding domain-containing protein n=1 Tax=Kingdonia uniflora TaxID=39325 RepID=A0A7J7MID8_9MAGN|nr:hypothetical protein GIB67_034639 [Kingdonia uniflora]
MSLPRVAGGAVCGCGCPKATIFGRRNLPADGPEQATFVLLDTWGDKFVQLGRKSLRSEEWHEVAKQVAQASRVTRTDTQCRNRLDTLKKKYKKEKMRLSESPNATIGWSPPPKKSRPQENGGDKSSVRCLTDSIEKFGQIYEDKIENKKRDQMVELEKMRMEFYRDLEIKKRQIMERDTLS